MKTTSIKLIFVLFLSFPLGLIAQIANSVAVDPAAGLEVSGIIFSSRGGVKFPDGSVQTTAYLSAESITTQADLSAIVMEFAATTLIEGKVESPGFKIRKGLNILSASNGMSNSGTTHMSAGGGAGKANFQDLSIARLADENSPRIRFYVATGRHMDYVELFFLKLNGEGIYEIDHKIRMEDCLITGYNYANGGSDLTENIIINFAKVYYCSYGKTGPSNTATKEMKFAFDIAANEELSCDCTSF